MAPKGSWRPQVDGWSVAFPFWSEYPLCWTGQKQTHHFLGGAKDTPVWFDLCPKHAAKKAHIFLGRSLKDRPRFDRKNSFEARRSLIALDADRMRQQAFRAVVNDDAEDAAGWRSVLANCGVGECCYYYYYNCYCFQGF